MDLMISFDTKSLFTKVPLEETINVNFKKLYGPFLWIGISCIKAKATSRRQFTFYH